MPQVPRVLEAKRLIFSGAVFHHLGPFVLVF